VGAGHPAAGRQLEHDAAVVRVRGGGRRADATSGAPLSSSLPGRPRRWGNQQVQRLARSAAVPPHMPCIQAKLTVGHADDPLEREADRVADRAGRGAPPVSRISRVRPGHGGAPVEPGLSQRIAAVSVGGGRPLRDTVRAPFERVMGADFGGVRVHTDACSDDLTRYLHARAFTTGRDIFFRRGQYDPSSTAGQRLIGHELTHVAQQSAGGPTGGEVVQRSIGFEFETDWGVHGRSDPTQVATGKRRLEKHTSYKAGSGFTVQVDEASRGFKAGYEGLTRQIEFVVDPHDESVEGGRKLQRTMLSLLAEVALLEGAAAQAPGHGFTYPGANRDMWVFPRAKTSAKAFVHARAQATAGFALPAITALAEIPEATLQATRRQRGFMYGHARRSVMLRHHRAAFEASAVQARNIPGGSPELAGLVTLLSFYIKIFHDPNTDPADYVKGYLPLLAKTNFAAMFARLPAAERTAYHDDRDSFVKLVLNEVNTSSSFQVDASLKVIPERLQPRTPVPLTLNRWLRNIPGGVDRLTARYDEALFGLGDLGKGKKQGKKVDPAPEPGGPDRMVIEFRSGAVQGFLTPRGWLDFVFDYYDLVRRAHGMPDAPLWMQHRKPARGGALPNNRARALSV